MVFVFFVPSSAIFAMANRALVAVIMGSTSDWETMTHAVEVLERFGVPYEKHVVSAHRTPRVDGRVRAEARRRAASK